jgi:hypothetical protein
MPLDVRRSCFWIIRGGDRMSAVNQEDVDQRIRPDLRALRHGYRERQRVLVSRGPTSAGDQELESRARSPAASKREPFIEMPGRAPVPCARHLAARRATPVYGSRRIASTHCNGAGSAGGCHRVAAQASCRNSGTPHTGRAGCSQTTPFAHMHIGNTA